MADLFIDVNLELVETELAQQRDPARYMLELARHVADENCAEANAQLRTDRAPEVVIGRGLNAVTGVDTVMMSSRWAVVAPDHIAQAANAPRN